ncbi:MAG: hypothetical protein EB067_06495 [Actinobacteria bacterium]|nr:hypothetical protein [Actinomycetota bacterium]
MKYRVSAALITITVLVGVALIPIQSGSAETPDPNVPIMRYCQPDRYACAGYVPEADEQYLIPWVPGFPNYQGYYHNDLEGVYRFTSYAIAINRDAVGNATSVVACKDIASSDCTGTQIAYRAVLPMCDSSISIDCFKDFIVTDLDGKPLNYTVEGQFPLGNPQYFKGNAAMKVPNGGGLTLIHIPGAPHKGGDTYLVKAEMNAVKNQWQAEFTTRSFTMSISAVKIIEGKYSFRGPSPYLINFANENVETGWSSDQVPGYCAATSNTQCALRYSLPLGMRFGLTVNLTTKLTGWLHGRVRAPEVEVSTNSVGGSTVKVLAEPIKVPVNAVWVNNDTAPQSIKDYYSNKSNYGARIFGLQSDELKPLSQIVLLRDGNMGHSAETLKEYLAWLPALGDKAQAMPTAWTIATMSNYQVPIQIQQCLNQTDSLAGIVTTNAAEYFDGPPVFDEASGSLDYKVAATHFEPDGTTVFKGSYDLVMSSKVARCIYGFTQSPISATVSVTSDSGTQSAATVVVNERNGWLSLGAYNFTYSSPTIRIKLTQDAVVDSPTPSATPTPKIAIATPKKMTTTICVKGKISKKVTAAKPVCPTGYKKK